jgi:hypothetical protein
MSLDDCRLLTFPKVPDHRGSLAFVEGGRHVPFAIARVYYLFDVPGGAVRGSHAHRTCHEVLIAITGSLDVTLDDGERKRTWNLRESHVGLLVPPMAWRELSAFTSGAVCLVLASSPFDAGDYIRDYETFLAESKKKHGS